MDIYLTIYADKLNTEDIQILSKEAIKRILNNNKIFPELSEIDEHGVIRAFYQNGDRIFDAGDTYEIQADDEANIHMTVHRYLVERFTRSIKLYRDRFIFLPNNEDIDKYNDNIILYKSSTLTCIFTGPKCIVYNK